MITRKKTIHCQGYAIQLYSFGYFFLKSDLIPDDSASSRFGETEEILIPSNDTVDLRICSAASTGSVAHSRFTVVG